MNEKKEWRFAVAGNIVKSHLDEHGEIRYGSKAFSGGSKIYIDGIGWTSESATVSVFGRNRYGRVVNEDVPVELIENVRWRRQITVGSI